jgi:hypothetical protein
VHTSWSILKDPGLCLQSTEGSLKSIFVEICLFRCHFFSLFFGVSCDGELFSRLGSMVHSNMHSVDIHFPHFQKKGLSLNIPHAGD